MKAVLMTIILALVCASDAHLKLNVPRFRLPLFETASANFTLRVESPGCYLWSLSRTDVVDMVLTGRRDQLDDGTQCSDSAVINTHPGRLYLSVLPVNAIVFAKDPRTGEQVRCDVIVDKIASIQIVTTTKELHLEEAPSKFHVRAYDAKMNEFTTLDGVPINWKLRGMKKEESTSVCRFIPFSQSPYKAPPGVAALEANGLRGSTVLIEGVKTGSAFIIVDLGDSYYQDISIEVRVMVVANLHVEPAVAFMLPGASIPLRLWQAKKGSMIEIPLPSEMYHVTVSNSSVAAYDEEANIITALDYGDVQLVVKDKNWEAEMTEEDHPKALTCDLHVRHPTGLALTILPHRNWAVIMGEPYEIQVNVLVDHHRMIVPEETVVDLKIDSAYFRVDSSVKNGTWVFGVPIRMGRSEVSGKLLSWTMSKRGLLSASKLFRPLKPVSGEEELNIIQNVALTPKETILPWDPNVQPKYDLRWKASGGGSVLEWSSSNTSIVTLPAGERGRTEGHGSATVTATSALNPHISGSSRVHVVVPTTMKIVDGIFEARVGSYIHLPIAFYTFRPGDKEKLKNDAPLVPYSSCTLLPLEVELSNEKDFVYEKSTKVPHMKPACRILPILGKGLGSTVVDVKYKMGETIMHESVTLTTFEPLRILEPVKQSTVLAVGSSRHVVFQGGPRPMMERHDRFFKKAEISNSTVAAVKDLKLNEEAPPDMFGYDLVCKEIGETDLVFSVGNNRTSITDFETKSVMEVAVVHVVCGEPRDVYFKIERDEKTSKKCPIGSAAATVSRVALSNYGNTTLSVIVKDEAGRRFDNVTSLILSWTASPNNMVKFQHEKWVTTKAIPSPYGYVSCGPSYQYFVGQKLSGNVEIKGEMKGYRSEILKNNGLPTRKWSTFKADDENDESYYMSLVYSMEFHLVGDVSLSPSPVITVFNHPSSKGFLRILDGSGHFQVDTLGLTKMNAVYHEENKTILVTPLSEGSGKVLVTDLCLPNSPVVESIVDINGVGSIHVSSKEKLQVNTDALLEVSIFDHKGVLLSPHMMRLVHLQIESPVDSSIIELTPEPFVEQDSFITYQMKGRGVGTSTIIFKADAAEAGLGAPGKWIKSVPKRIAVYPPLSLEPKNLTLLIGSVYQVIPHGGPQTDVIVEFTSDDEKKALVSSNGIIEAKSLGKTLVRAQCLDASVSSSRLYSEETVIVNVVNIDGIRIHAPLTKIKVGERMPVWVMGIWGKGHSLSPAFMTPGSGSRSFTWGLTNRDTGKLEHGFQEYGYRMSDADKMEMQFEGLHPGHVTIRLYAEINGQSFHHEIDIEVIDALSLLSGFGNCPSVLMSPNAHLNLKTHGSGMGTEFSILSPSSGLNVFDHRNELITVDRDGNVRSFENTGTAVILVSSQAGSGAVTQSFSVLIEVKRVSYMMASGELPVEFTKDGATGGIPRGLSFPFHLTYHDNLGRKFAATNLKPFVRPNRLDVAQMTPQGSSHNETIPSQTVNNGRAQIQFGESSDSFSDFVLLSVANGIVPTLGKSNIVRVGDVICLSSRVKAIGSSGRNGYWTADNHGIVSLDRDSGIVIPLNPGSVTIEYKLGSSDISSTSRAANLAMEVVPLMSLEWLGHHPDSVTNGWNEKIVPFEFPFLIDGKKDVLVSGSNCSTDAYIDLPFLCDLSFVNKDLNSNHVNDLFDVYPAFNFATRQYVCRVERKKSEDSLTIFSSVISSHVALTVSLRDNDDVRSKTLTVPFHPAVYVHSSNMVIPANELTSKLTITGLAPVLDQIHFVQGMEYLSVRELERMSAFTHLEDKGQGSDPKVGKGGPQGETRTFSVSLDPSYWVDDNDDKGKEPIEIRVRSPLTNQDSRVYVKIRGAPCLFPGSPAYSRRGFNPISFLYEFVPTFGQTVITSLLAFWVIHLVYKYYINPGSSEGVHNTSLFVSSSGSPQPQSQSFLLSTPSHPSLQETRDPGMSGDGGSPIRRLYSTQNTTSFGYGPYKRTPGGQ